MPSVRSRQPTLARFLPAAAVGTLGLITLVATAVLTSPVRAPQILPMPTPVASSSPSPSPSPSPAALPVAPLTGLEVADVGVLELPIIAVKVENSAAARPQSGLDEADVVIEELVEGGVTRFIALFHSRGPASIGPVRSARLVDAEVLPAFGAVLAVSGGRPDVKAAIARADIPTLYDSGSTFTRDSSRNAPHNLYTTWERLLAAAGDRGARAVATGWTFDEDVPRDPTTCSPTPCPGAGTAVEVAMSAGWRSGWTWDGDAGLYRRSQNGAPFLVTGPGRIGAANVVVLGMQVGPGGCCDPSGASFTETTVTGEGPAIVLRDGRRYDVRWTKASAGDQFAFVRSDGTPLPLAPGPTWIHLAPRASLPPAS